VVFPLGMYSVATLAFGQAAHVTWMEPLARFMLWVAVAAWVLVAAAFVTRLARHRDQPAAGAPAAATPSSTSPTPPSPRLSKAPHSPQVPRSRGGDVALTLHQN
jgi:hypothetical protein